MGELERVCNESEEVLQKNLTTLREIREYSKSMNEADTKLQGKESSRLMELNIVCSMEKQRRTMEELHRTMMTDLKIRWDSEERELSFTRTLFNGDLFQVALLSHLFRVMEWRFRGNAT